MTKQKFRPLGVDVELNVPATVEEFGPTCLPHAIKSVTAWTTLADWRYYFIHGVTEADLKADPNNKTFVPGTQPIKGVEDVTGIERKTKQAVDAKGQPRVKDGQPVLTFDETEEKFFKRVIAEKEAKVEDFVALGQQIADALVFNAEEKERAERAPAKLAAKYKVKAGALLANGTVEDFGKLYSGTVRVDGQPKPFAFTPTGDMAKTYEAVWTSKADGQQKKATVSDADADKLGWLIKEYSDAYAAQAMDAVVA